MKIVLATNNPGKVAQFRTLFKNVPNITLLTLDDIGYTTDIPETGNSYEENSAQKAQQVCKETGYICLGEDSGLNIDALPNILGLYTARYMQGANKQQKLESILALLKDVPEEKRTASFTSVVTCQFPNGDSIQTKGTIHGTITTEIVNMNYGMAYTPIFKPIGSNKTLSQLSEDELVQVNHRGIATKMFLAELETYLQTHQTL